MYAISMLMLQSASEEFERTVMSIEKQLHISSCCSNLVSQIIWRIKNLKKTESLIITMPTELNPWSLYL
jgi:hypothetical protein